MVRSLLFILAMLMSTGAVLAQSTVLQGKVTDDKNEALIGATVKVMKGSEVIRGTITDIEGNFRLTLDPGTYDVEVAYTGYKTSLQTGVQVLAAKINTLDILMSGTTVLGVVEIVRYKVPLIEQDKNGGTTLTSETIKNLPTRSLAQVVGTTAGVTTNEAGDVNIKGSRKDGTNYYIDGIRVYGNQNPPLQDIEQVSVITGGLGAEYGDVTGGVISIITKGPAPDFHGGIEIENSRGLDPFGWFLGTANISGPIIKKKEANGVTRTVVGFRLSGQYNTTNDEDPIAIPVYHVKDGVLAGLDAHPLRRVGTNIVNASQTLTRDSVDSWKYRPFEGRKDVDLTGKLDFKLTNKIDLSVTGTFFDRQNQDTPTDIYSTEGNQLTTGGWGLLNSQNNPTEYTRRYRGIARFRHRLGNSGEEGETASTSKVSISNASYQLQFGFERGDVHKSDKRHGDNLFDYGYIGRFGYDYVPIAGPNDSNVIIHLDNRESFTGFQAGYINKAGKLVIPNGGKDAAGNDIAQGGLVAFNEFANPEAYSTFLATNGTFSQIYNSDWGGMATNVNQVFNRSSKTEDDVMTIGATSSFDLKLGKTGIHNIQFGLLNEQRTNRSYAIAPFGLWNLGELSINSHFNGLDYTKPIGKFWDPFWSPQIGDSIVQYANATVDIADNTFYKKVRQSLNVPLSQWVNIHELTPEQLSLNMFAPRELTEQRIVKYYGYDYLGNKQASGVTFNDFFTSRSADGVRDFPVAALNPLYQAAFLKDKFTFNNMIFSLGLRVERFDLNTKVMRDQQSLYQIENAGDYYKTHSAPTRPATIGDDFKVYVEEESQPNSPKAFRNGDTWYYKDGTQANDGNLIFGGGVVTPLLSDTVTGDDIFDPRFDPNTAFEDYTPQVNWLPRLAFSFPISKDANFFAHYDVLVQRPSSNWEVTPLDYFYFYVPGRTPLNNANLKPERVVDYEVGFQQRLNQNSALKFSAYYREQRDMIQRRTLLYVPVIGSYDTYGNIDFGTVKGFTLQYDLRRIQNTEVRVAYTLQFADGTGSDANSQRGLTSRGNIRTLYPLTFDERHNIQASIDYRFDNGNAYNGPRIGGKEILADFGANLLMSAVSGRPYTAKLRSTRFNGDGTVGSLNGNRLPWRFNVDLRLDKSFNLSANDKKPLNLNIYLRIANLLNTKNIVRVYPATGSPTSDGYLASLEGQSVYRGIKETGQSTESYLDTYSWIERNPNNYSQPRRIFVGAVFGF